MFIAAVNLSPNHGITTAMILQMDPLRNLRFVALKVYLFASALFIVERF